MDYALCFDLGTTGAKTTLFDECGNITASAFARYETSYPRPGWAEQRAEDWWDAAVGSTREVLAKRPQDAGAVAVVGLCGHMMGCLPVDGDGAPLAPSLIHSDTRSEKQCARIARAVGAERLYQITGNIVDPHYPLSKIPWFREEMPEAFAKARFFVQSKDYLAFKLTGALGVTDHSDASLSALYDIRRREWSEELLEAAGIEGSRMCEVVPSATVIGHVTSEAAAQTGLREGTPVVIGGGDGACATVGAGAVEIGDAYSYIGGTAWISVVREEPLIDPEMRLFNLCDLDPAKVNALGTIQCAGSSLEWFADQIAVSETRQAEREGLDRYDLIGELALSAPPGANGLFFLPYLMGERAPIWDPLARGVYFGLTLAHTRADLARATLEGVAYALNNILRIAQEHGSTISEVRAIGGGAEGEAWAEIMASVYGKPVAVTEHPSEATSRGAFAAAAMGVGLIRDWREVAGMVRIARRHEPDPAAVRQYARFAEFYESLYPDFQEAYRRLGELMGSD